MSKSDGKAGPFVSCLLFIARAAPFFENGETLYFFRELGTCVRFFCLAKELKKWSAGPDLTLRHYETP